MSPETVDPPPTLEVTNLGLLTQQEPALPAPLLLPAARVSLLRSPHFRLVDDGVT